MPRDDLHGVFLFLSQQKRNDKRTETGNPEETRAIYCCPSKYSPKHQSLVKLCSSLKKKDIYTIFYTDDSLNIFTKVYEGWWSQFIFYFMYSHVIYIAFIMAYKGCWPRKAEILAPGTNSFGRVLAPRNEKCRVIQKSVYLCNLHPLFQWTVM